MTTLVKQDALPAHLGTGKTKKFSNADASDLIIPRIKLLQPLNPEVEDFADAKPGNFWHTVLNENWGPELKVIPINMRKSYVLWAPRGDERGVLARANDAIHWVPAEGTFKVKFEQDPATYVWTLKPTVAESGLDRFGTSRPGDADSKPAAALTYEWLFYFPEHGSCALVLNTRGSVKQGGKLYTAIETKPRDAWLQQYIMRVKKQPGPAGSVFNNYEYIGDGYVDADMAEITASLEQRFGTAAYQASDEQADVGEEMAAEPRKSAGMQRSDDIPF